MKFHFGAREDMSEPILLLLDDVSGHWTNDIRRVSKRNQRDVDEGAPECNFRLSTGRRDLEWTNISEFADSMGTPF
ncbi:unnamed protein product [Phytophthora fragariaefolia]|uniref:Unnamed protein product n=1 Tax=Phytophthora fragariaefolia TaxID=1490495 RepID=A0A9W6XW83_9STRA|nr:unnamed protein product [Phytophthora fragariaefolia]